MKLWNTCGLFWDIVKNESEEMLFFKETYTVFGLLNENESTFLSPNKINALAKYPRHIKQVEGFLGLDGYFIKLYLILPTDLRKKNREFEMNEQQISAFARLKDVIY